MRVHLAEISTPITCLQPLSRNEGDEFSKVEDNVVYT